MVQLIDKALLLRRSEHNDKNLTTLREISLHQFDIPAISKALYTYCKSLEILYLQANQIKNIENVGRLKALNYLQLSLNNIEHIGSDIRGCESLEKLDLTMNFVKDLDSLKYLRILSFSASSTLLGTLAAKLKDIANMSSSCCRRLLYFLVANYV